MTRPTHILAVALLFTGTLAHGAPPGCPLLGVACQGAKSGSATPICLKTNPTNDLTTKNICLGSSVTLRVTATDQDTYGDPINCDAATPTFSWTVNGSYAAGNQSSYAFGPLTPGSYTITCTATNNPEVSGFGYDAPQFVSWTVNVVLLDIDVDSNNDGVIDAADEPLEEETPGKILGLNGATARVNLSITPTSLPTGCTVVLSGTGGIAVWLDDTKQNAVPLPAGYAPGSLPSPLWVSGTSLGGATLTLTLQTPNGNICPDRVQLSVYELSPAKLQDVTFKSGEATTNYFPVYKDLKINTVYPTPHWHDVNLNGNATESGDNQSPACYTQGTHIKVSTTLTIPGGGGGWPNPVKVKGEGPGGLDIAPKDAACSGGTITLEDAPGGAFESKIYCYKPLAISWFVSTDGGSTWKYVGTSANSVYVTLAAPLWTPLYHTTVDLSCTKAYGETTYSGALTKIWAEFATRQVKRVNGTPMKYWGTDSSVDPPPTWAFTVGGLLQHADGRCGAWALFFKDCLNAQGDDLGFITTITPKDTGFQKIGIYINNQDTSTMPPTALSGIPAQNNDDPISSFTDHAVVKYTFSNGVKKMYDPSYGNGPYDSLVAWENAALAIVRYFNVATQQPVWVLNASSSEETQLYPAW